MSLRLLLRFYIMAPLLLTLAACSGTQTFTPAARAGDTVVLPVGYKANLLHENLTVKITDANGVVTTYLPNDDHVRAILNLYPDPASYAVVDMASGQTTTDGYQIGSAVQGIVTSNDSDWWQTSIVLDLPANMAVGLATISMSDSAGAALYPQTVTIVGPGGTSNLFNIYTTAGTSPFNLLDQNQYPYAMAQFEREPSNTVTFTKQKGVAIPHSLQIQFSHTPGIGTPWIVNPRGDIKDVMWRDDGSTITVMLMSTQPGSLARMSDFKFYVSGNIDSLGQVAESLKAYDVNGSPVTGISATVQ